MSAERLVSIQPFSGARVTLLDDDDVRALMQLRSALEGEAVRLLNRQASAARDADSAIVGGADSAAFADALASIHAANAELRRACIETPDDRTRIETTHAALHHAIVEAANSARITDAHARLEAESILFLAQLRDVLDADEMIRQHDALVAALLVDGEAAVHAHLERAADQLISARAASRAATRATRAATRAAAGPPQP